MTEAFGEIAAAWGDDAAAADELAEEDVASLPGEIDLGGGFKLVFPLPAETFRTIMHSPEITAQVQERCEALVEAANSLAVIEGAEYTYFVSNNPDNIRARGRVKPGNFKAMVDDALNSTLWKALASVGSDPKPDFTETEAAPEGVEPAFEAEPEETVSSAQPPGEVGY